MKPYYQDEHATLYHGDCLDVLPRIGPVDLVVTSPPYNKGSYRGAYVNMSKGGYAGMGGGYRQHTDDLPDDEYIEWQQDVIGQLWALTAIRNGAIFYNHKTMLRDGVAVLPTRYIPDGVDLRQIIIWNRGGGFNHSPSHFCPHHELVLLLAHPHFRLKDRFASAAGDVWNLGIDNVTHLHPCAFPESLPAKAIAATSAEVVLDPFAGSGTTLRAATNLGRKSIGIEIDESYCELIARRLDQMCLDFGQDAG